MKYRCRHCGRIFKEKCAHKCNTGFRKRNLNWDIVELTVEDYDKFKTFKDLLDGFIIPIYGRNRTLQGISAELHPFSDEEEAKREEWLQ